MSATAQRADLLHMSRSFDGERILVAVNPTDSACELTVGGSLGEVIYSFGSGAEISGNSCVIGAGSAAFVKLD